MRSMSNEHGEIRQRVFALLENIPDPEIPVVSIRELGILRDVVVTGDHVEVTITPTYSGCPAMHAIEEDILAALRHAGFNSAIVRTTLTPAWSSDWITPAAREKLRAYGIAPPGAAPQGGTQTVHLHLRKPAATAAADPICPHCGSQHTERLSEFGSTSCKALYRCVDCREPFDYFKPY